MDKIVLNAVKRDEKSHVARKHGFIPGIIYGEGVKDGLPVKFEKSKLDRVLARHGLNAKIYIEIDGRETFGIIKEVQRDPLSGAVIHMDVQQITATEQVRLKLPIQFHGRHKIEERKLLLQVYLDELDCSGEADVLPESIMVDVTEKQTGDMITIKSLSLDPRIKIHHEGPDTIAIVTHAREKAAEVPGTAAPAGEAGAEAANE